MSKHVMQQAYEAAKASVAGCMEMRGEHTDHASNAAIEAWCQKVQQATDSKVLQGLAGQAPKAVGALAFDLVVARMGFLQEVAENALEDARAKAKPTREKREAPVRAYANQSGGLYVNRGNEYGVNYQQGVCQLMAMLRDQKAILRAVLAAIESAAEVAVDTRSKPQGGGSTLLTPMLIAKRTVHGEDKRDLVLGPQETCSTLVEDIRTLLAD